MGVVAPPKKMFQVGQNIVIHFNPDKFIWGAENPSEILP